MKSHDQLVIELREAEQTSETLRRLARERQKHYDAELAKVAAERDKLAARVLDFETKAAARVYWSDWCEWRCVDCRKLVESCSCEVCATARLGR